MNKYNAIFKGRKKGAIGILYPICDDCCGNNEEEARLELYNRWEHISDLKLTLKTKGMDNAPENNTKRRA